MIKKCKKEHFGDGKRIFVLSGLPTPDYKKIVAIYSAEHPLYPAPANAIIYHADGSLFKQLTVPKLISGLAKSSKHIVYKGSLPAVVHFSLVNWEKDSNGTIALVVRIVYNMYYYEERILNAETGEFEECLSSGMT